MAKASVRHVVVTGASSGIGRALALAYAQPGVVLGIAGRNEALLESTAAACRERGATVIVGIVDVREPGPIRAWLHRFDDQYPIDLLIANAGVASTLSSASDWEDLDRITTVVDTNFYGAMHTILPIVERMRIRKHGRIAAVSSLAALRGMAISPAYCASKSAIKAYADSVRPLLKRDGVSVSVILPGFVKTSMSDVFPGDKPFMWTADQAAAYIRRKLDIGRAEIAFPSLLAFGMRILTVLPITLADAILDKLSYLPGKEDVN
ncbi:MULTISPECIES: SDR family NAD(P)-dependent oxidoreductase [Burkholderia]|uniref:KR domain-containing protein n=1 Tax=Burkholderia contaminans TaxID=488447 RepID=A0A2S5DYT0_9BURK|nr:MULTISPECIES: SDR family NAD(P)-dependent oxidoreductase [Burkholderia]EKS9799907.1 SDR family NAD(P)-dependent oxidoreductase [Burkholderia cepacia]EKS9806143.1 SDR family NAD(P)-dependent oxidoreductase [Burkholderia cepacia]EKS9809575.1 SDR family NAD(P)-dependent oxidoreductase [Burkholderia cepacia]EKS9823157.1 SDR family NAD(P)-dependent oxidoreductase [Burkholderia cepacia]EKS9830369.1 SDR family NAD(P)-dependent oxidoreductase [Burkholderia cepacia]